MNVNPITSRKIPKYLTLGNFDSRPGNHEVSAWSFGQNGQNVQPCHRDPVQISRQMCWQEFTKGHFFPVKPKVGSYVRWYLLTAKKAQIAGSWARFFFLSSGVGKSFAQKKHWCAAKSSGCIRRRKGEWCIYMVANSNQMYCLVRVYDIHCIMHQCNAWEKASEYKQLSEGRMC